MIFNIIYIMRTNMESDRIQDFVVMNYDSPDH